MSNLAVVGINNWLAQRFVTLVPDWLRAMFAAQPMARAMQFDASQSEPSRNVLPLHFLTEDANPPAKQFKPIIDAKIPQEFFLARKIQLPRTAGAKVEAAAALDLRQRTPFGPQDVYWQLGPITRQDDLLEAIQWVVKKSDVARWQKRLAAQGYRLRQIHVDGVQTTGPIANFSHHLAPRQRGTALLNLSLLSFSIIAAMVAWLYPGWIAQSQTIALKKDHIALQTEAVGLRRSLEKLRGEDKERTAFYDMILHRPLLVETLRELTIALPDEVWVSALSYTPNRLVLSAETTGSAADIALGLAKRRALGNPRLSGAVQRTATGAERFELTVDLRYLN